MGVSAWVEQQPKVGQLTHMVVSFIFIIYKSKSKATTTMMDGSVGRSLYVWMDGLNIGDIYYALMTSAVSSS